MSHTSTVTLTGATWPTDAVGQHIRLNGRWFPCHRGTSSSTVIKLAASNAPPTTSQRRLTFCRNWSTRFHMGWGTSVQIIDNGSSMPVRLSILENPRSSEGSSIRQLSYSILCVGRRFREPTAVESLDSVMPTSRCPTSIPIHRPASAERDRENPDRDGDSIWWTAFL